ncbi:MAG TPA: c-type cytochrome [Bryobacteraceae bacterium]|jgi:putative heme-binding domain-containing protein|nr:c-type cytochrome [Bryobacteraceae bacterium]
MKEANMSMQRFAGGPLMLLLIGAYSATAQDTTEVAKGKQLFLGMCSRCHGVEGGGGEGPNLNRPVLSHAPDDQALATVIRDGIPDRGMPRIRRFTDAELHAMVIYIRSLSRNMASTGTGNREKGKAVYQRSGCSSCHIIDGAGGGLGPELTSIGAHRAPDYLRQSIVDPAAVLPRGVMTFPGHGFNEFLPVRVVTRDGRDVRGVRVNEDSFTIQVRDRGNQLYSFRKADLQTLDKQIGQSMMPDYKSKVSGSDLDDLIAYLSSLGAAQ